MQTGKALINDHLRVSKHPGFIRSDHIFVII